jgi:hypothetical protein
MAAKKLNTVESRHDPVFSNLIIGGWGTGGMMGQRTGPQERLFYEFRLDEWVPYIIY